jgi:hypothetical protein
VNVKDLRSQATFMEFDNRVLAEYLYISKRRPEKETHTPKS